MRSKVWEGNLRLQGREFQQGVDSQQCQMLLRSERIRTEKRPVDLCVARPLEPTEDPFRRVEGADLGLEVKVW